jgi:hypothetical protein
VGHSVIISLLGHTKMFDYVNFDCSHLLDVRLSLREREREEKDCTMRCLSNSKYSSIIFLCLCTYFIKMKKTRRNIKEITISRDIPRLTNPPILRKPGTTKDNTAGTLSQTRLP